ncbi:hypothetical protein K435DRAFT_774871 [Dendrothele bispora CBS 962.96]|uniref:Uncharacterized protein n=1 Tax=Dendrothele bispora (strain CBS 962.96) TaxID=1314807 RepID=A0A4S8MKX5_DENBC|nr:hypothetical protein K435DRAFT_774871 [Dendrothele bispora CBS 962.96]
MTVDQVLEDLHENPSHDPEAAAFIGLFRLLPTDAPGQSHTLSQAYAKATSRFPPPTILNTAWHPLPQNTQVYRIYDATKVDTSSVLVGRPQSPYMTNKVKFIQGHVVETPSIHLVSFLPFLATHFQMGYYFTMAPDGYQPPEECLKTYSLLWYLRNELPSVPEGTITQCPRRPSSSEVDLLTAAHPIQRKTRRPRKLDMSKVKAYVEEYLQSLKDPVDDLPSFDDLALTPLAEDPDEDLPGMVDVGAILSDESSSNDEALQEEVDAKELRQSKKSFLMKKTYVSLKRNLSQNSEQPSMPFLTLLRIQYKKEINR